MFRKPLTWLPFTLVLSFLLLLYPMYVIRPFRRQGPEELAWALRVLRFRPPVQLAVALTAVCLCVLVWRSRQPRMVSRRIFATVCTLFVIGFGLLSCINLYEKMFHPLDQPQFMPVSQSKLDGAEHVIAVRIGGAARAYPIRGISYHHIVNDTLNGVPIAATY